MAFPFNIREDAGVSDLMEVIAQRSAPGFRTSPGARSSHSFQGTSIRHRASDLSWSYTVWRSIHAGRGDTLFQCFGVAS